MSNLKPDIRYLFEPRSVAVIGASATPGKIGYSIISNIISGNFKGEVYPINPKGGEILGRRVYASVEDAPGEIDMVTITVPAKFVVESVRSCARKKVKHIQIITSGFSEAGNSAEEQEIVCIARENGMRILGPNIFGFYSAPASINATFSATPVTPGHVAIITQSGALGIAMIGKTGINKIGLSAIVSTGNKCDIDEADLLEYLVPQEQTKAILMYIEGVKNGDRLIRTLRQSTPKKPIIIIKSGKSKRGAMAAASHTGSLAGSDDIFDAIMRQCGVIRAETIEQAFNWSEFLAFSPTPKGTQAVIITNGGGVGVLATDACEKYRVDLLDNQELLKEVFTPVTPSFGSTKNPIDITGGAQSDSYNLALSAPVTCDQIHATIALYCETASFDSENMVPMIRQTYQKHLQAGKPITYAAIGGEEIENAKSLLRKENIPVYSDVDDAVSSLGVLYRYERYKTVKQDDVSEAQIDVRRINEIIDHALLDKRNFVLANEGAAIMAAAGIPIPKSKIAKTIDQAVAFAEEIGYPVVMKIVSRDILHKSDAGGVALDLDNREEVIDAFEAIMQNCRAYNPKAVIDGIEVGEMVSKGTELIVGARIDSSFGPVVMCGSGGIYVEVIKDVAFRGLPLNHKEIMSMLKELRAFPILLGVRGEEKKDIQGVVDTIIKVGTIIKSCPKITDLEINPIMVYGQSKGLKALDTRILIKNPKEVSK